MRRIPAFVLFVLIALLSVSVLREGMRYASVSAAPASEPHSSVLTLQKYFLPVISRNDYVPIPPPPDLTFSRYVQVPTYDYQLYLEGATQACNGAPNGVVILDFGKPADSPSYGTYRFDQSSSFTPVSDIEYWSQDFIAGLFSNYYACYPTNYIWLGIGTSNFGPHITENHGLAWAQVVQRLNQWVGANGWGTHVLVVGANDIEVQWNNATTTRRWVAGFSQVPNTYYVNFGNCAGCGYPNTKPAGWEFDDLWYVSAGATPAYVLPEIYGTSGTDASPHADQWYSIGLYTMPAKEIFPRPYSVGMAISTILQLRAGPSFTESSIPTQERLSLWAHPAT